MYNSKSKGSAILTIVAAVLLAGFLILLPFLRIKVDENVAGAGFAAFFGTLFGIYGYVAIFLSGTPFFIVALIFGVKMLREQQQDKLISLNVRMLIAALILLPFLVVGGMLGSVLILGSQLGLLPLIYAIVIAIIYLAAIVSQIVAIVALKKPPKENSATL